MDEHDVEVVMSEDIGGSIFGEEGALEAAYAQALIAPTRITLTRSLTSVMCTACNEGDCIQRLTVFDDGAFMLAHGVQHEAKGVA